jgi:gas vesicle protein
MDDKDIPIKELAVELQKTMKTIEEFIPQQTVEIQKEIKKSYENLELFTDQKKEIDTNIERIEAKMDQFMEDVRGMLEDMDKNIADAIN